MRKITEPGWYKAERLYSPYEKVWQCLYWNGEQWWHGWKMLSLQEIGFVGDRIIMPDHNKLETE